MPDKLGPGAAGVVQLQELFQRILNLSIAAAFIIIFLLLLSTTVTFMTSAGDPKGIKKASDTITWALLGVLFLALAWLILKLIEVFTGVKLTEFCIGFPGVPTACIL